MHFPTVLCRAEFPENKKFLAKFWKLISLLESLPGGSWGGGRISSQTKQANNMGANILIEMNLPKTYEPTTVFSAAH